MTTQDYLNTRHSNFTSIKVNELNIFRTKNNVNESVFQICKDNLEIITSFKSKKAVSNYIKNNY